MSHMMAMEKRTGKSAKMGILPMRGTLTWMLRRYCEKRMRQMMVGMPICTHEPTPFSVSPQPATPRMSHIVTALRVGSHGSSRWFRNENSGLLEVRFAGKCDLARRLGRGGRLCGAV